VFTRPGRCNVPSGAALPAPSNVNWGSRVLRDCRLEGHGSLQQLS
jgi:hypothetical protein